MRKIITPSLADLEQEPCVTGSAGSPRHILKVVEQKVEDAVSEAKCCSGKSTLVLKELSRKLSALHCKYAGQLELGAATEGWSLEKINRRLKAMTTQPTTMRLEAA